MSRHKNVKKLYQSDDWDDDYDDDYEEEPDIAVSPTQYIYTRDGASSSAVAPESKDYYADDYTSHTVPDQSHGVVFTMDALDDEPSGSQTLDYPPGFEPTPVKTEKPQPKTKPIIPNISNLKLNEKRSHSKSPSRKKEPGMSRSNTPVQLTPSIATNSSSHRLSQLASISSQPTTPKRERKSIRNGKDLLNLVIVGHVDAGKSTLMGHLLVQMGCVDQRLLHKYKQESSRAGKSSFAFAWVLDETEEERNRGVTMDIAKTSFETDTKRVVVLDAPGHKDFIPNMITGASQADAAILVVNATTGEFETGFENGGQTKEHAMLLRSLGVSQLVVAINKLDMVNWSQQRFDEIQAVTHTFLTKMAGFSKVSYVPVSGLVGENLVKPFPDDHPARDWYKDGPLIQFIDNFTSPARSLNGPLRVVVSDVIKSSATSLSIYGKIESGDVAVGDKVYIMPNADAATVKACTNDNGGELDDVTVGDLILLTLTGTFEPETHHAGDVLVRGGMDTLLPGSVFTARIVVFDIPVPLMKGTKAELYCHSLCVPCTLTKLVSSINKSTGDVIREKPRCLSKNMSGVVEIRTDFDVAIEPYTVCKALGRITLRAKGVTIGAGIIEKRVS